MASDKFIRFGGVSFGYPNKGDRVLIKEGECAGTILIVVDVSGYVYDKAYKIYVLSPEGEQLWYWPWNIEVLLSKKEL